MGEAADGSDLTGVSKINLQTNISQLLSHYSSDSYYA